MIIVDSCVWLEWFTDGKLANQYREYLAPSDNILQEKLAMADAIIVAISRIYNYKIISSDADFKEFSNVKYISKK